MMRMGRRPDAAALVAALSGSDDSKRRLTLFLETLSGHRSVAEACAELNICESRFYAQRAEWLEGSVTLLEPGSPGRPAKREPAPDPTELNAWRERVRQLESRLTAAEVRSELACLLPRVAASALPVKKTT
jgi:hypothetical protein